MAFSGVNTRATSGYITDDAGYTYSLGEAYPTTRGGLTFGWSSSIAANTRNRATSHGAILAGIGFQNNSGGTTVDFRLDLPAAGTYRIRLCSGDFSAAQNSKLVIKDGATVLATINGATPATQFMDAAGTVFTTPDAYVASNAFITLTFATTQLIVTVGGHSSGTLASVLNSIAFEAAGDTTPPTLTSPTGTGGALTCSGTVSTDEANGALYCVFTNSASAPSAAQVEAGLDHTGSTGGVGRSVLNQAVSATGVQTIASGAIAAGTWYPYYMHKDAAGNRSAVASASSIVVTAAGPTINTQPSNQTATAPATATFTVSATASGGSLSYQWQRQPAAGGGYANVSGGSGATTASYTTGATSVTGGGHNNGDTYRVLVTDSNGTTTSSAATLTVNAAPVGLTSSPLKDNTGTLHLSAPFEAFVLNVTTGALVLRKQSLTSHASTGVVTFTDAALTAATQYRVVWRRTDTGAQGIELLTAA